MEEIYQQISKEEKYIIHDRGLHAPNAPPDCQSHEFKVTSIFTLPFFIIFCIFVMNNL